jgi:2-polyprenyl-6-methoxyphenol hydroxylase-like FAD-dependent oxidoreductase
LLQVLPPGWIKLGYSLVAYETRDDKVVARFTNGVEIEADFLIGADGLHSDVRAQLLGDGPPRYRGYTVWRGIASVAPDSVSSNTALEIHGRGQRFGLGPVGNGRVGWWATANAKTEQRSSYDTRRELLCLFKDWYKPALDLIEATPSDHILTTPAFDREAVSTWGAQHVTLLGDAIHPTTPNLGQGGCLAMEDAFVLASTAQRKKLYENTKAAAGIARPPSQGIHGFTEPSASGKTRWLEQLKKFFFRSLPNHYCNAWCKRFSTTTLLRLESLHHESHSSFANGWTRSARFGRVAGAAAESK